MAHFPVFIELKEMPCLIFGGGRVAARKVGMLLTFGAKVTVIAESFCEELQKRTECALQKEHLTWEQFEEKEAPYVPQAKVVIAATNDERLNHSISLWCKKYQVVMNSATSREDSTFIFPAIVRKGGLILGITSEGKSPLVTKQIRKQIERCIPEQLEERLAELEEARRRIKEKVKEQQVRQSILQELVRVAMEEKERITTETVNQIIDQVVDQERKK